MGEDGCTCDDPDLVTVQDRNMSLPYVSGNPFSRYCRTCGRRYFCAKSFWEMAKQKFIIPQGDDEPVKADEYEEENFFECPVCGHPQFGFPENCDECGEQYEWGDAKPEES